MPTSQPRPKTLAVLVIAATTIGFASAAPPEGATAQGTAASDIDARLLEEQRDTERRVLGMTRARLSFPQRFSAAVGAMWAKQPVSYDCHAVCEMNGPFVQLEPGYSGGQISVGYAWLMAEKGSRKHFLSRTYMGYGVRAAVLRTWNDADLTPPDQTLAGVEADFSIININFSLGAFRHVGSGSPDRDWILTGGVGWGF